MRQDRKIAFMEKELTRLREEVNNYKSENTALAQELENTRIELRISEESRKRIQEAYEKYMFGYSEKVEQLEEARVAYEDATKKTRQLMREYKKDASKLIASIKNTGKAV